MFSQRILKLQPSERPLFITEGYNICKPGTTGYILRAVGTISGCVCRYFSQVGDFFETTAKQRTVEITVKPLDTSNDPLINLQLPQKYF